MTKTFNITVVFTFLCAFAAGVTCETSGLVSLGWFFASVLFGVGAVVNYMAYSSYRQIVKDIVIHSNLRGDNMPELVHLMESANTLNEWISEGQTKLEDAKLLVQLSGDQ